MPRYFFHIYDGNVVPDLDGCELPDINALRVEALRAAGEMLRDGARSWLGQEWVMIAGDKSGAPVMTLRISVGMAA